MAAEQIAKLQPDRTVSLLGFDRRGAAAAIHSASADGFKCSGVFRDFADFAVVVLWNADNAYEHYTMKYLPDFDFNGVKLVFDLKYNDQLQPIDSPKSRWIPWDALSIRTVTADGVEDAGGLIPLWDNAKLQAGVFSPASATWTIDKLGPETAGDRLALYFLDIPFEYVSTGYGQQIVDYGYYGQHAGYLHELTVSAMGLSITDATNTNPVVLTTSSPHGYHTGDIVTVDGVQMGTDPIYHTPTYLGGTFNITVLSTTQFSIPTAGLGTYGGGGVCGSRRSYWHVEGAGEYSVDACIALAASAASDPYVSVDNNARTITDATNASPIAITTSHTHGLTDGMVVRINSVGGNTAANGVWFVHAVDSHTFTLDDSTGNGEYTSGGVVAGSNFLSVSLKTFGTDVTLTASDDNMERHLDGNSRPAPAIYLANLINRYDWPAENPNMAIMAAASADEITLTAARFGTVDVASDGRSVTWAGGDKFTGVPAGADIYIQGNKYTVQTVDGPAALTLVSPGTGEELTSQRYLTERGGMDGNMLSVQARCNGNFDFEGSTISGTQRKCDKQLAGGSSNVTWRITIDWDNVAWKDTGGVAHTGVTGLRKAWLTLAPKLGDSAAYVDTDFTAEFSNWAVTDPNLKRPLKVAGPGSVRVGSRDDWTHYQGTWVEEPGWYWGGYARGSSTTGDVVRISYSCQHAHDLYVGTSMYVDRGIVDVSLDGDDPTTLDCYAPEEPPVLTRRKVRAAVPAGEHNLTITLTGTHHPYSAGSHFYFDYLEAAVTSDVPDPAEVRTDVSPALDFDTDQTYHLTPQRLVWNLDRLGLHGDINEYVGVFWWAQRKRVAGTSRTYNVEINDAFLAGDTVTLTISGVAIRKTVTALEQDPNPDTPVANGYLIAKALVDRINATFVGVWAERTGVGKTVTVHPRSPLFSFTAEAECVSENGTLVESGNLDAGSEGVWEVDPAQTPTLNKAARDWHSDLFGVVQGKGWPLTASFSMEVLNPPAEWAARYASGLQVLTSTGFGTEALATVTGASNASPVVITAEAHGYNTGDSINVAGVGGNTAANGVWQVTVVDANHFSLNGSTGNGTYTSGGQATRNLRTTHCALGCGPVIDFQKQVYADMAGLMEDAGLTPWLQFGEFLWWFQSRHSRAVEYASNTAPISLGVPAHGLTTGQTVIVSGVRGNTAANGTWQVTVTDADHFTLDEPIPNGDWVAGSGVVSGWGMAFYDPDTTAAALTALGRPLKQFYTQDDDPLVNSHADADFLAGRLKAHIDAIRAYVVTEHAGTKFELLFPCDVTFSPCYHTLDFPWPQGGRLNSYVNLPSAWKQKAGSGLDRLKIEALSWGVTYRNIDNAKAAITFPFTSPCNWSKGDVRYLIPLSNGGCPWVAEFLYAHGQGLSGLNFWALDHFTLLSWPLPLPSSKGTAELR